MEYSYNQKPKMLYGNLRGLIKGEMIQKPAADSNAWRIAELPKLPCKPRSLLCWLMRRRIMAVIKAGIPDQVLKIEMRFDVISIFIPEENGDYHNILIL